MTGTFVPHPGETLWADYLEPLNLTVGRAAKALNVTRKTLSAIVNGRQSITPDMSVRLSKALGTAPDKWARLQLEFDMSNVVPSRLGKIRRLTPADFQDDDAACNVRGYTEGGR